MIIFLWLSQVFIILFMVVLVILPTIFGFLMLLHGLWNVFNDRPFDEGRWV